MNSNAQSRSAAREGRPSSGPYSGVALERHKARCRICRHPRREEIEEDFLGWSSPRELAETYELPDFRTIYRHANALGLFDERRNNIQRATDRIIERVGDVQVNALAVVAAIRITLNEERKWLDCVHRLMHEDLRGEPPSTPAQKAARAMPQRFCLGLAPGEDSPSSPPPARPSPPRRGEGGEAPEKISLDRIDQSVKSAAGETVSAKPVAAAPVSPAAPQREQLQSAREKSAFPAAPNPAPPAESQAPERDDPYNAPGQVAGIPWPWPAKKIQFARRRFWRPIQPG